MRFPDAKIVGLPRARTAPAVVAAVPPRVATTRGVDQPLASRMLNQISTSDAPSRLPAYQTAAIRPSSSSAVLLACALAATSGKSSCANSEGTRDGSSRDGGTKAGIFGVGARKKAPISAIAKTANTVDFLAKR